MSTITCPHCNQHHPSGARFCPITGNSIPARQACSNCGNGVQTDWRVCPVCGMPLGKADNVEDAQPQLSPFNIRSGRRPGLLMAGIIILFGGVLAVSFGLWKIWPIDPSALSAFSPTLTPKHSGSISSPMKLDPSLTPNLSATDIVPEFKIEELFTATQTAATIESLPATITPAGDNSLWIDQLEKNPIIPGIGLAGIELGYEETKVIEVLGNPSRVHPVQTTDGNVLYYAMVYEQDEIFLGLYTTVENRTVFGIRLNDSKFNKAHIIPTITGISIGSTETELTQALGNPLTIEEHFTCPEELDKNRHAATFKYSGISFWVCEANKLIYLMDIP